MDPFSAFEHEGWQRLVGPYDDYFGPLTTQCTEPLLDAVRAERGMHVLDVATGPGYVAAAAARREAEAVGLDFSAAMLAEAARRYPDVKYREGSADALPFPNESFDAVVISFGMLHFAQPDRALGEAQRVLKRGGRIAFSVWATPEKALGFGIVLDAIQAHGNPNAPLPPGPPFFRFSDAEECRRSFSAAGFAEPRVAEVPQTWRLASPEALFDAFWRSTARTGALLRAQSADAQAKIRQAVAAAAGAYRHGGGEIELPMPAVLASATKT